MQDTLFPAGLIVSEEYLTFADMKEHEKEWDIQSVQMKEGTFHSRIYGVHTPNIQIATQSYSTAMQIYGTYPKGCVMLCIFESETPVIDHDRQTSVNEILVGSQRGDLDFLINTSSTAYTLAVEEDLFYQIFYQYFLVPFEKQRGQYKLLVKSGRLNAFFDAVKAWMEYLSSVHAKMTSAHQYDLLEAEILNAIFDFIMFEAPTLERKRFNIALAKKILNESLDNPMSIEALSKTLNISERQLHHAFKSNYKMTPKKFLHNLRLNAVKEELLAAKAGEVKIEDVAFKYGFQYHSHFTREYKKLFGEMPSSTLAQQS